MGFDISFSKPQKFDNHFVNEAFERFLKVIDSDEVGFFHCFKNEQYIEDCKKIHSHFKDKKSFVHVGIGGSGLGPKMIVDSLSAHHGRDIFFIENVDPDSLYETLEKVELEKTLFYFVSKSGGTAETMASMAIISHLLEEKGIGKEKLCDYFVFATDPEVGDLRKLSKEHAIKTLEVPTNVGGRFSVLTPVAFLPALFAGISIDSLVKGATEKAVHIKNRNLENNNLVQTANYIYELAKSGVNQTVFMPYSTKLKELSFWFIQLWAESLGKGGKGLTPIPAVGATDQHSQMQLFMEGPNDKCLFLIENLKFDHDFSLENNFEAASFKKLSPYSLSQLMKAELYGTIKALQENDRPLIHIKLENLDEANLAALILFFESLTVLLGEMFELDPFNQPGVEAGKKYAFEWLEKLTHLE